MSIETVKSKLATIEAEIAGIQRAYVNAPRRISAADLPCFVNFTGPGQYSGVGPSSENNLQTRTYLLRLYVRGQGSGIDGEAESACLSFFESVPAKFASYPRLQRSVMYSRMVSDSGISLLRYGDEAFVGIEFRLEVRE